MRPISSILLNLVFYLWLIAFGALIGAKTLRGRSLPWLSRMQTIVLFLIILALGIQLGANDEVVQSVGVIGLSALLLTTLSMAGSLLFAFLLRRFILKLDRHVLSVRERRGEEVKEGGTDLRLTWIILSAVILGVILGLWGLPEAVIRRCAPAVSLGLDVMLFLVGLDLGFA